MEVRQTGQTQVNEALVRSHARLQVLADVSAAFARVATDYKVLLQEIARTTADLVGDGCMVTLIDESGENLINVANAHRQPQLEVIYTQYLDGVGIRTMRSASVSAEVVRTGTPTLVHEIDPAKVVEKSDPALRPLVAQLNVNSFAVVPIRARTRVIGTLSLLRSGPGRGYTEDDVTLLQDLADRAGLAIQNARLYDDLERRVAQRTVELEAANRELEAFSYSVAHDLRAPLRSIDGFSQALLEDCADRLDATGLDYLQRVRGAAQHMSQLINDLLRLARVTRAEVRRSPVDLSRMVNKVMARLREAAPGRDAELVVQDGITATADPDLLEIALTNLLDNAWKFTAKKERARIEFGVRPTGPALVFFVRDNGAGFDATYAGKLFGVFQRLHTQQEFEGTGIGLATVARIIRQHGGRIWAEGENGLGATFFFTLAVEGSPGLSGQSGHSGE